MTFSNPRLLSGLLERWQGLQAIPQASGLPLSMHHFHHCPCKWPTPQAHLARIPASRPDQWCHRCHRCPHPLCLSPPQTCPTILMKQFPVSSEPFLLEMWVWTVSSDGERRAGDPLSFIGTLGTTRRYRRGQRHRLIHVHGSKTHD